MKTYKAFVMMLVLVFSLSPCSLKRDLLDIFDIQHISSLNKVKTTTGSTFSCDSSNETSSGRIAISKKEVKINGSFPSKLISISDFSKDKSFQINYSGTTTGSSPPKYILFKQLRLNLV